MNPRRAARTAAAPATPPAVEVLPAKRRKEPVARGVPKDVVIEVVDEAHERRLRRAIELLGEGRPARDAIFALMREYRLAYDTARNAVEEVIGRVREHMDNEGSIDAVMYTAVSRSQALVFRFYQQALDPIPDRVMDVPGPNPDDPTQGAIYRPLTVSERATEMQTRVAAAKVALAAQDSLTKLIGRRSARWADKPAQVAVQVNVGEGLSPEDRATLERLRLAAGPAK